jgi:hypothetical protein
VEAYATALRGEPGADSKRRPACVRVDEQMLHYATTWLPLVSFALIAAAVFALASIISGGAEF